MTRFTGASIWGTQKLILRHGHRILAIRTRVEYSLYFRFPIIPKKILELALHYLDAKAISEKVVKETNEQHSGRLSFSCRPIISEVPETVPAI